jgi:hypothetical protein
VQLGVHEVELAVAHLVPVVLRQLELGRAAQADLAGGDEVVEPAVGPALEGEEGDDLLGGGGIGQPPVDVGHEPEDAEGPHGAGRVVREVPRHLGVAGLEVGEEGAVEAALQRGHRRVVLEPLGTAEVLEGGDVQVVDEQEAEHGVPPVDRFGLGERVDLGPVAGEGGCDPVPEG